MPLDIFDTNAQNGIYKFNLSKLSEKDWVEFAFEIIYKHVGKIRNVVIKEYRIRINDNIAKITLEFQGSKYHVLQFRLNEFGVVDETMDSISVKFQEIMSARFGEDYKTALESLNGLNK